MKKAMATLTIFFTLFFQTQANAVVGSVTGNMPVAVAGLAAGLTGMTVGEYGRDQLAHGEITVIESLAITFFVEVPAYIIGATLLEDENAQKFEFKQVSPSQARKIGLNEREFTAYNSHVEELTVAMDEVSMNLYEDSTTKEAKREWDFQKRVIGELPVEAAQKVISFNLSQLK